MSATEHFKEIDRFLSGAASHRDGLVQQSWRRCVDQHGLDPTRPNPAHIVPETTFREHREQSERLIAIARSGLETLFRQVAGQNYVLLLADSVGVTVDYFGDPKFENALRDAGLHLGADWSENLAGTCGVGSCIATGEAITIHQTDHFDLTHTPLSCTAAPIFDTHGALSAVLDVSLLRSPQPKASQSAALQLVMASARRIELANLMATMRSEWVLRFSRMPEFLDVDPEAAIALDGSGYILGMTHGAAQILARVGGTDWRSRNAIVGQPLSTFFDLSVDDLPTLTRARPTEDRVLTLRDGSTLFGHAIEPQHATASFRAPSSDLPNPLQALSGEDPVMRRLEKQAAKLANGPMPILILGESGTGKERLARALHNSRSHQQNRTESSPFAALNCAALPEAAIEAALFGPELSDAEDASPDNTARPRGLLEAANGGTLFLDEIGDMPLTVQARLLRALSDGEMFPSGVSRSLRLRVKVLSASHRDIKACVRAGTFRHDLFFRLAAATLTLPPLRDRRDFDWLLDRLLRQRTIAFSQTFHLSTAARMDLKTRSWPGNIRELINTLDVALAMAETNIIDLEDLPRPVLPDLSDTPDMSAHDDARDLETVLKTCGWNIARAARHLGVDRTTVHRRMQRMGLRRPH